MITHLSGLYTTTYQSIFRASFKVISEALIRCPDLPQIPRIDVETGAESLRAFRCLTALSLSFQLQFEVNFEQSNVSELN
ncbi:hypothetical protein TMatcc_007087 [Talaromyces marneffei ATCC 18224]